MGAEAVAPDGQVLELLMRGGAVGAFLGAAIAMARRPFTPARITGVSSAVGAAAHTLTQLPQIGAALAPAWPALWALSAAAAGLFWAFATELFEDRRRLRVATFAPAVTLLAVALAAASLGPAGRLLWLVHNLLGGVLMAHALAVIWAGWRNDLVESRRRLRGPILAAGALYAAAVLAVQSTEILWRPADALSPVAAAVLLLLGLASVGALLKADPELFAGPGRTKAIAPSPSPEDLRLAARLERLMREERIYRQERLSVGALATRVGAPEHRLRRLINGQLGHRNFSAFLNEHRLAEAREALADPAQREVPVATIALDAGFQSLGPFNRAFKADTGLTPTAFRERALRQGARPRTAPPVKSG